MKMYYLSPAPPHPRLWDSTNPYPIPSSNLMTTCCCTQPGESWKTRLLEMRTPDSWVLGEEEVCSSALNHVDLSLSATAALGRFTSLTIQNRS